MWFSSFECSLCHLEISSLFTFVFSNDAFCNILRNFLIVRNFHGVVTAALSLGAQVGSVAEHLCQGHIGIHLDGAGTGDLAQDVAPAGGDVADDSAHILIGHGDGNLHDGLQNDGVRLPAGLLEGHGTGDLKCHFGGVHLVVGAVEQGDLHVHDGIASQNASLHCALNTGVNSGDILLGDGAADDGVDELIALAGLIGSNLTLQ